MDGEGPSNAHVVQLESATDGTVVAVTSTSTAVADTTTAVGQHNVEANNEPSEPVLRNLFDGQNQQSG